MKLYQARDDLQSLAEATLPWDQTLAIRLRTAAETLVALPKQAGEDDAEAEVVSLFDAELKRFKEGSGWWNTPNNLAINRALPAWNFWQFTILPMFPAKRAFREDLNGLVIRPYWRLASDRHVEVMTPELARKLVAQVKDSPTVQATVEKELAWIEQQFSVQIPGDIKTRLATGSASVALGRWSVNRLRLKDRLIPLDGGRPRDLGAWE